MMMDAQNRFEEQDLRIADLIEREGRAVVLAVNKWDLMESKGGGAISNLRRDADHLLPQIKGVPIVAVSGLMGEGIDRLMQAIQDAYALWNRRVSTAALNRWFEEAVRQSAAGRVRTTTQAELHHADQGPPAKLRVVLLACGRGTAVVSAISHQFAA